MAKIITSDVVTKGFYIHSSKNLEYSEVFCIWLNRVMTQIMTFHVVAKGLRICRYVQPMVGNNELVSASQFPDRCIYSGV